MPIRADRGNPSVEDAARLDRERERDIERDRERDRDVEKEREKETTKERWRNELCSKYADSGI